MKKQKQHPKIAQIVPNMTPKSTQVGPMLGVKAVQDPSRWHQNRPQNQHRNQGQFFKVFESPGPAPRTNALTPKPLSGHI